MKAKLPVRMSKKEEKAMDDEINRQIVAREESYDMDYDAALAWVLHKYYGFDLLQLLVFRKLARAETKRLRGTVLASGAYPQRAALKSIGYDVEELHKQDKESDL